MDTFVWSLLGYVVYPVWLLIGLLDYATHQRTHIAQTSGVRESALHVAQAAQIGLPVLIVLFFGIDTLTLSIMTACVLVHTATAYADISFTSKHRQILPLEQFVHAFLIVLPILALLLVAIAHRHETIDMAHGGAAVPAQDWKLHGRQPPWDTWVILAVLASSLLCSVAPAVAELVQTGRALRRKIAVPS
jgi:hypothetical protein